ncbi:metacaspase-1-like [Ipomoea triloba]|uniref:metacaspase-1-like n=1 Tax=Ipomoea triloba TaxID=35885 RepID=UPI00125D5465|nr:metacaspase-1-like [Ipomoea triloba]
MKEIDPSCEPALQATIPSIVKRPSHYNPPSNYNPERNRYSHSYTHPSYSPPPQQHSYTHPSYSPPPQQHSYTHPSYSPPPQQHSYTHPSYSPPPQQHNRYFHETPPFAQNFTQSIPYERPSCEYHPPVNDEIKILKDKLEMFIQMAKEDTIKLRDEIRSEMKKNLVTLRKEGLSLDEIEAKMLSMSEELMKRMLPMDHPTMETDQQESDKMDKMIDDEEVCVKESTELDTPVLQEVSIPELNTQQWGEIESME